MGGVSRVVRSGSADLCVVNVGGTNSYGSAVSRRGEAASILVFVSSSSNHDQANRMQIPNRICPLD